MKLEHLRTYIDSLDELVHVPGGVDRLRSTILFLAFTGKLVAQDDSESSADDVIRQLEAAWEADSANGKLKLLPINENSVPLELPKSWRWVRLARVCSHIVDCLHRTPQYSETGFPAIRTADMMPGHILFEGARRVGEREYKAQTARLEPAPGDIFYSREGNYGMAAVVPDNPKMCLSQRMMQFRVGPAVDPHFFSWALNSPVVFDQARADVIGTTVPHINIKSLRQYYFPLAPELEQLRIVNRLLEIFSVIDRLFEEQAATESARRQLSRRAFKSLEQEVDGSVALPNILELVRKPEDLQACEQVFLGMAVRGSLVAQKAGVNVSDELAKREIPAESFGPWELPHSWSWVRLGNLAESVLGKMLDKAKNKGVYHPYLGNSNVRWFGFDLTGLKEMKFEDREYDRYAVLPGDVIVCEGGEAGRAAVWTEVGSDMRIQKALHRVRCNELLRPEWLVYSLRCFTNDGTLKPLFTGIGIPHLTGVSLKKVVIPLPPVEEQDRILARLEDGYTSLDRLSDLLSTPLESYVGRSA